ncbi:MFS transporter [Pseudoprimorskyibacter insulae]|uniref:Putative MFS-type transporter YcaD n=1 Tax=Pseudoprimorskyibacter insulae TaxID=1695997 RepID=A0A2R8AWN2_9RHOB|nr:MFS transporter [Pseudoprimorskyibacter insulae]SPF80398.1 putative MFS-type transporter YcaD [Pseudoprimorskyibacter insulae]
MIDVFKGSWALLLGLMLLMVGNGIQGTLLGVRGALEGFSTLSMSVVMACYFVGFLGGSRLTPELIRRVGHVRVFAALGSFVSAILILYSVMTDPISWSIGRVMTGFCFSGLYVTAESWLNNSVTNEHRGKALSLYMMVQMIGIVMAQMLLVTADPAGFVLFIIPSVLVSISFAPILLSVAPTPAFETTKPMTLKKLYQTSPLGCVGMFLLGGVFSAQYGMAGVFAADAGLNIGQISIFVSSFYVGATIFQYPLGWVSDRMDRRLLILLVALVATVGGLIGWMVGHVFIMLLASAFIIGATTNPLYSLMIAYTNDFLEYEDMAAASGGLIFINGLGAIMGPIVTGYLMGVIGPYGYFVVITFFLVALSGYAGWRMTQRPAKPIEDTTSYAPVSPTASVVALEAAQEYAHDQAAEDLEPESDKSQF